MRYQDFRLKIPQTIRYDEITLPEQWSLDTIVPSQKIENDKLDFITQETDNIVVISFGSKRQTNKLIRCSSSMKSRTPSYMLTPRTSFFYYRSMNPNQEASHPINTTVEGICPQGRVETPFYTIDTAQPTPNVFQPVYQYNPDSPTQTNILGPEEPRLNVISHEFVLDK